MGSQVQVVDEGHGPHHRVVAAADVEAGIQIAHRRGAAAHGVAGLDQHGVHTGPGQVGGADETVVAAAHHHHVDVPAGRGATGSGPSLRNGPGNDPGPGNVAGLGHGAGTRHWAREVASSSEWTITSDSVCRRSSSATSSATCGSSGSAPATATTKRAVAGTFFSIPTSGW